MLEGVRFHGNKVGQSQDWRMGGEGGRMQVSGSWVGLASQWAWSWAGRSVQCLVRRTTCTASQKQ